MRIVLQVFITAVVGCGLCAIAVAQLETEQKVAQLLADRCLACHGPTKQEGGYRVDSFERLRKSGDSGARAVVPGASSQSELYNRLVSKDDELRMPAGAAALPPGDIALIESWIADGAKVNAELETKPINTWVRRSKGGRSIGQYPSALPVTALALASDTEKSVSLWTSGYGEVLHWQVTEAETTLLQRSNTAGVHVSDVDQHDDRWLVVASGTPGAQGYVELFVRSDAGFQLAWTQTCADLPADLAFAPDGKHVAVGQSDGTLLIVSVNASQPEQSTTQTFSPHADAILSVGWSDNGDRLITGSRDRTAKIFDTDQWQLIANYDRHERAVGGVAYLDRYPVSLDETGKLRLWSGDDSDRTVAERDNQARFLEPLVVGEKSVWFAIGADLRSFETERKTVDEGKDEEGKPKQKTTTRWKLATECSTHSTAWLLALDTNAKFIAAGNEAGEVFIWRFGERQFWRQFTAKP